MDYMNDVIQYIEHNIGNIFIKKVDELGIAFNVSKRKFFRDFKREMEWTPRCYVMRRKIEIAQSYKSKDPTLTVKEVVSIIGWDLSERHFCEQFKRQHGMTFGGKTVHSLPLHNWSVQDAGMIANNDFPFSKERKLLEEIIFRMVLITGEYSIIDDKRELCRTISFSMSDTCFRLPLFVHEKDLLFSVSFNRNNYDNLDIYTMFTKDGDSRYGFIPNDKSSYLNLIYNVAIKQNENIKNEILESISNWEEMTSGEGWIIFDDYRQNIYSNDIIPQINRNAGIFTRSQSDYDSFVTQFKNEYGVLLNNIGLNEPLLSRYMLALEEANELMILSTASELCKTDNGSLSPEKLDLLLRLAEYPNMEFIELVDYAFNRYKPVISDVLEECAPEDIPKLIYDYHCAYKDWISADDFDDADEFYGDNILIDLTAAYLSKKND